MKLAYYDKSKFASIHIRILYRDFMVWRCYVIAAYCVFTIALMAHKYWVLHGRRDKQSRDFKRAGKLTQEELAVDSAADPDAKLKEIQTRKNADLRWKLTESAAHCCCLEVIVHAGCGRLIGLPSVKTRFWYAALGQELLLHQLPLTLLIIYNNKELDKKIDGLDLVCLVVAGMNVLQIFVEVFYFRHQMSKGKNLERRVKISTRSRIEELCKIGALACLFLVAATTTGFFIFTEQKCKSGFFTYNDYECRDCQDHLGENCIECTSENLCDWCVPGFFVETKTLSAEERSISQAAIIKSNSALSSDTALTVDDLAVEGGESSLLTVAQCSACGFKFPGCVTCTEYKCTQCEDGYYRDERRGTCLPCGELAGCVEGACTQGEGCTECKDGYYKDGQGCTECRKNLKGCGKCKSATECTECTSTFLQI